MKYFAEVFGGTRNVESHSKPQLKRRCISKAARLLKMRAQARGCDLIATLSDYLDHRDNLIRILILLLILKNNSTGIKLQKLTKAHISLTRSQL